MKKHARLWKQLNGVRGFVMQKMPMTFSGSWAYKNKACQAENILPDRHCLSFLNSQALLYRHMQPSCTALRTAEHSLSISCKGVTKGGIR